jgi:hypothetical protein
MKCLRRCANLDELSYYVSVDSLLASNNSSTKKSCRWIVCTQDTNLLLITISIIMDVVEVGAISGPCSLQ